MNIQSPNPINKNMKGIEEDKEWNREISEAMDDNFEIDDLDGAHNRKNAASKMVNQSPVADTKTVFDKNPQSTEAKKQKNQIVELFDPETKQAGKKLMEGFDNEAILNINEDLKEELFTWDFYLNLDLSSKQNTKGFKLEKLDDSKSQVDKNQIDSYTNLLKQKNNLLQDLRQKQVSLCLH